MKVVFLCVLPNFELKKYIIEFLSLYPESSVIFLPTRLNGQALAKNVSVWDYSSRVIMKTTSIATLHWARSTCQALSSFKNWLIIQGLLQGPGWSSYSSFHMYSLELYCPRESYTTINSYKFGNEANGHRAWLNQSSCASASKLFI